MSTKQPMKLSKKEIAQFESLEKRRATLERTTRDMLRNVVRIREEDLEKLSAERDSLWKKVYTKFGLDPSTDNYSINRETGELKVIERDESDEDTNSAHTDPEEDCGDPNCRACKIKRLIREKIATSAPTTESLFELMQSISGVLREASGEQPQSEESTVKVKTPLGILVIPRKGNNTTN